MNEIEKVAKNIDRLILKIFKANKNDGTNIKIIILGCFNVLKKRNLIIDQ